MHCNGRDISDGIHIPDFPEEFFLRINMVRIFRQKCQKIKFFRRKNFLFAVQINASCRFINFQAPDFDDIIDFLVASHQPVIAGHMRLNPGYQLGRAERLSHIIVGTEPKPSDFIDIVFFRGYHENRNIFFFPDAFAYLKTVHAGQHQIENHQIEIFRHGSA